MVYVVLVFGGLSKVGLSADHGVACAEHNLPYTAAGRRDVMATASDVVARYGERHRTATLFMAGAFPNERPVPYVIAAVTDEAAPVLVDVAAVADHPHYKYITLAVAAVEQMIGARDGRPRYSIPIDAQLGACPPEAVAQQPTATPGGTRVFEDRNRLSAQHIKLVRRELDAAARAHASSGDLDMAEYLLEVHGQVVAEPFADVPPPIAAASANTEEWMIYAPYHLQEPRTSDPLPLPCPQPNPSADFAPTSIADLHVGQFLADLADWFQRSVDWLMAVATKAHPLPERPECFVRGQEVFCEAARGIVWDTRRASEGIIVPADFTQIMPSKWNVEWLATQWRHYPDQETVSHVSQGADLKGDLPLQYCFSPHLMSISEDYATVLADIAELRRNGYYAWYSQMAFCPCRFNGQGTRPKGDDVRRIASGSCPYEPIPDGQGVPALSINAATRLPYPPTHDTPAKVRWRAACLAVLFLLLIGRRISTMPDLFRRRRRFRKERKPRVEHAMNDTVVMRAVGDQLELPVYYFSDDFKHFFYQIRLAAHCLWYTGLMLVDPDTASILFIVELGLAMGFTPCSNIAQSVGDALLWIFDNMMAEAEAASKDPNAHQLDSVMRERARRHGARHGRPWTSRCYTDDCLWVVLGSARLVRTVVVWRHLLRTARVLGAKVAKRQLGCHVLFLGVNLLATAMVALVPEHKLARAVAMLNELLGGKLSKDTTRKLLGLLVHLSFLSPTGRASTAGMWRCLHLSRSDPVRLRLGERSRCNAWLTRLHHSAAATLDVALRRKRRARATPSSAAVVRGQSDAYLDRQAQRGGIGGYAAGALWRADVVLPNIGAAEFLAMWVHFLQMSTLYSAFDAVEHQVDNTSAFFAAVRESAKTALMQFVYDAMRASEAVQRLIGKLRVSQRWGAGLFLGDAASRDYRDAIALLSDRLRVTFVWQRLTADSAAAIASTQRAAAAIAAAEHPERPVHRQARQAPRGRGRTMLMLTVLLALVDVGEAFFFMPYQFAGIQPVRSPARARTPRSRWTAHLGIAATALAVGATGTITIRRRRVNAATVAPPSAVGMVKHPRPRVAPRARMARPISATAAQLLRNNDDSPFALRPDDPGELHELCAAVDSAVHDGVNPRTAKGEASAWNRYYVPYCRRLHTATWRTWEATRDQLREATHACGFALDIWNKMQPRTKDDVWARVDSVRNVVGHVRRAHDRRGYVFANSKIMAHVFKGLARRRLTACRVPVIRRAEPFTVNELLAMKRIPEGAKIGRRKYEAASRFWKGWRLVDTFTDQTGVRKSEIVGFDDICFTHADVQVVIDGVTYLDVGPEQLARLRERRYRTAYITVAVNVSKADSEGTKFGPNLISLSYNPDNPMSFAVALIDYYVDFPVRGAARHTTPLFTTDGVSRWTDAALDAVLAGVMKVTLTPEQRRRKTMHSKRVFVACALRELKSPDSEIQALVRWSSLESLRIYARMGLQYQAARRDALLAARIDTLNAAARATLPQIDPSPDTAGDTSAEASAAAALAEAFA